MSIRKPTYHDADPAGGCGLMILACAGLLALVIVGAIIYLVVR